MNDLFDYKREMSALRFTEEQKELLAKTAASAAQDRTVRKRRPVFRAALIAAVMAVVLAAGSGAAGILPSPIDVFAPLFGGAVAQTEVIDKIGHPIGASATDNGITISADAIMGDEYNAVIVYTISRDDGERFFPESRSLDSSMLTMGGFGGASWAKADSQGTSWFVDDDPEDNKIQMVETVSANAAITKGTARTEFWDLCYWNTDTQQMETLYPGKWKLRFEVDYEDCSFHLDGGETFSQDGLNFTIDAISISPLAVKVDYTVDTEVRWSGTESGREPSLDTATAREYLGNVKILLTKTDGTVVDLTTSGGRIHREDGVARCARGQVFEELIPLEDMASISVGGVIYNIPHN